MTGKPTPSWKTLEQLVAQIHANLAPTASVRHNELIIGKSGAQNQCDVTIRANVAQYNILCVIECKDWADKVGVETIRGFVTKLSDVGAAKGAIVAASGFTLDAEKLSEHHGIDLFVPVDTEGKWKEISPIPLRVTKVELTSADVETYKEDGTKINFEQSPLALGKPLPQLLFWDAQLGKNISYKELLEREWDRITNLKIPDANEWHSIPFGRISIRDEHSAKSAPLSFRYRLIAETRHYYGHVSYKRCQGLINKKTGKLHSSDFESDSIEFKRIISEWPYVTEENELPIQPIHTFWMVQRFFKRFSNPSSITLHP